MLLLGIRSSVGFWMRGGKTLDRKIIDAYIGNCELGARVFFASSSHNQSFECISCQSEKFVRESRRVTQSFGINLLFVLAEFFDLEPENKTLSQFWIHEGKQGTAFWKSTEKSSSQIFKQTNGLTKHNYFMDHNRKLKKARNQTWPFYFLMKIRINNLTDGKNESKGDLWLAIQKPDFKNFMSFLVLWQKRRSDILMNLWWKCVRILFH